MSLRSNSPMSVRSDDGDSTTTSSSSRRRSRGILDRLRGARNQNKQKERKAVLDVLQNIRLKANTSSSSYSFNNRRSAGVGVGMTSVVHSNSSSSSGNNNNNNSRNRNGNPTDEDELTAATTATPSLASTATSSYARRSNVFSRKPIAFSHLQTPSQHPHMMTQEHSIPSIAATGSTHVTGSSNNSNNNNSSSSYGAPSTGSGSYNSATRAGAQGFGVVNMHTDISSRTGSSTGSRGGFGLTPITEINQTHNSSTTTSRTGSHASYQGGSQSSFHRPFHAANNHQYNTFRQYDRTSAAPPSTNALLTPLYNAVSAGAPKHVVQSLIPPPAAVVTPAASNTTTTDAQQEQQQQQQGHPTTSLSSRASAATPSHHYNNQFTNAASNYPIHNSIITTYVCGMTPLHCAIERYDTPMDVLLLLLASDPQAAAIRCSTNNNCHSIDLLYKRFVEPADYRSEAVKERARLVKRKLDEICGPPFSIHRQMRAQHALQESADLREFWETVIVFVQTAQQQQRSHYNSSLFHGTVAMDCEPLIVSFAAALHPQQVRQVDGGGSKQLLLHVAAAHQSARTTKAVLRLYPQAASRTDAMGRLPLHYAILRSKGPSNDFCWQDGVIQALLATSPKSYTAIDSQTGLPPVLLAAAATTSSTQIMLEEDDSDSDMMDISDDSDSSDDDDISEEDDDDDDDEDQLTTIFSLLLANPMDLMNHYNSVSSSRNLSHKRVAS